MSITSSRARGSRLLSISGWVAAGASVLLLAAGSAGARNAPNVPPPPEHPTRSTQIQNIDQVRTAIKGYYGDTVTTQVDPVPNDVDGGDKALHTFDPNGAYAKEVGKIVTAAERTLKWHRDRKGDGKKAVLFDVDDTTINTYSYEIYSNFVYNPSINAAFVDNPDFDLPAVPHMVDLVTFAKDHGYEVFYLTGRGVAQLDGTIQDLDAAGYAPTDGNVYTKDLTAPWLSSCAPSCSTIQYKSLTRQHIESLGFNIVASFGDQYSDLEGGFADKTVKLPNPMYYLP